MGRKIDLISIALCCLTGLLFCTFLQSCKSEFDFIEESLRPGSADAVFSNRDMTVNFSSAAGSASVDIKAADDWTARFVNDRTRDWCSISTESGKRGTATINISVKDNNEYDTRSASIIFTSGKSKLTISVAQKQKDAILVSGNRLDVPKEGGQFTIDVSSNIKFDCHVSESAKSWITLLDTRSGLSESKVILRFSANDAVGKREGDIFFSSGQVSETVKVYQDGEMPTIILSADDLHVSPSSSKFSVEVRSNIDVKVEIPSDVDWIHEFKTRSLSSSTYEFITSDNNDFNTRTCLLKFSSEEWGREEFLSVTQDRNPIVVSPKTVKVSGRGCTLWIATSNTDKSAFITKTEDTWLSLSPMQDNGMIPVEIQALGENGEARSGFILVYHESSDVPDTVVVHQHEICPSFSYSTTSPVALAPVIGPDPTVPGFILWGDGTCDEYSPSAKHLYSSPGPHIITVEIAHYFFNLTLPALGDGMTISFREIRTLGTYGH